MVHGARILPLRKRARRPSGTLRQLRHGHRHTPDDQRHRRETTVAPDGKPPKRGSFRQAVASVFRNPGALVLAQAVAVAETASRMVDGIAACWQRERPGRSYPGCRARRPGNGYGREKRRQPADALTLPAEKTGIPAKGYPRPVKSMNPVR